MADATHDVADGMRRHAAAVTDDDNYTPSRLSCRKHHCASITLQCYFGYMLQSPYQAKLFAIVQNYLLRQSLICIGSVNVWSSAHNLVGPNRLLALFIIQ